MQRFVIALNAHNAEALAEAISDDFTYIDSWREGITGKERVMEAVAYMFATDPDFGIEVDTMDYREPYVLMTGRVNSRSFGMGRRAVWQVTVRDGLVAQYQAWAEGGPPPMTRLLAPKHAQDMGHLAHAKPDPQAGDA